MYHWSSNATRSLGFLSDFVQCSSCFFMNHMCWPWSVNTPRTETIQDHLPRPLSVIVSNIFSLLGTKAMKQIHHLLKGHYTSPKSPMMRNHVQWKNQYSLPIITLEQSRGENVWVIDCYTLCYSFQRILKGKHTNTGRQWVEAVRSLGKNNVKKNKTPT